MIYQAINDNLPINIYNAEINSLNGIIYSPESALSFSGIQGVSGGIGYNSKSGLGFGLFVNTLSLKGISFLNLHGISSSPLYQGTIYSNVPYIKN